MAQVKKEYDEQATTYESLTQLPLGLLEQELVGSAIGDCTGLAVLDLGGGTGLRARDAIARGAASVDVVDVSPEMLASGRASLGGEPKIRWFEADVSKPLSHLADLKEGYDLVMANWVFDHAESVPALEGMWANVSAYAKPGGRFMGIRSDDPWGKVLLDGRYGVKFKYEVFLEGKSIMEFEASSMEISYSGSTELHEKYGFENVVVEDIGKSKLLKDDPEYWALWIEEPSFKVVSARKRKET
ncbi:methyltransferase-like protein [Bisporella sp. PMI_857]|nr:methyltransferase-like protein [Bisporella sp. PMI_857]